MNDPTPSPPEPTGKPTGFVTDNPAPVLPPDQRKSVGFFRKYWWLPFLASLLGLGVATAFILGQAPTYVSKASLCETARVRLPESTQSTQDASVSAGSHAALLQSKALRDQTLARLKSASPAVTIPLGKDGEPLPVAIYLPESRGSSVVPVAATGSNPAFIQAYLDALLNTYLDYRRNARKLVSGDTLASITEQVQRAERELRDERETLQAFQRTNNLEVIEAHKAVAVECLKRLNIQLSDLQLEDPTQKRPALSQGETSASPTVQAKLDYIRNSIKEWENKITEASALKDEVDRLKLNIQRSQSLYERLVTLVQNVAIERNISQETFVILEPASVARRTHGREKRMLAWAGFGGLGLGLGLLGLLALKRSQGRIGVTAENTCRPTPEA